MIDLHTHLLPAVDDGSPTMENSLRVLERFAADGIRAVACTPHLAATQVANAPVAAHASLLAELQHASSDRVRLVRGFEIMLDRLGVALTAPGLALGSSRATLVEFPHGALPDGHTEELLRLRASGLIPVLAHPERYRGATFEIICGWREVGAVMQGDALTLLATGPKTQLARRLLDEGCYDLLASDNHGDRRSLATVRLWLRERGGSAGEEQGRILTEVNPARLLAGERLEAVPPLGRTGSVWQRVRSWFGRR